MSDNITLWMDGRIPITVDEEEFELIKMRVKEMGVHLPNSTNRLDLIRELIAEGYGKWRAMNLVVLARTEVRKDLA